MNIRETAISGNSMPRLSEGAAEIDFVRKIRDDLTAVPQTDNSNVPPEELLKQITTITEDGLYSVRFEIDEPGSRLVVKIVDRKTSELVRQLPAEELLHVLAALDELRGNIVNTSS